MNLKVPTDAGLTSLLLFTRYSIQQSVSDDTVVGRQLQAGAVI